MHINTTATADFPYELFRAYDIRGRVGQLTPSVVFAIAQALVAQLQTQGQQQLVLGYDARLSSPQYAAIVAYVARKAGLYVVELGCCSTPVMYFHARNHAGNGIMVTASHNPKNDNGFKWLLQGQAPSPEHIQHIAQLAAQCYAAQLPLTDVLSHTTLNVSVEASAEIAVDQNAYAAYDHSLTKHVFNHSACDVYRHALRQDIQLQRPLKVVLDGLHGSAGHCAQQVFTELGCEVIALRCMPNGHFPDHAPDPSHAVHLSTLQQQIIQHQADVGIALDGDGDRLVMLDQTGHIINPDRLLSLCAVMCLQQHPQHEVVFDVKCSTMVRDNIVAQGGIPTMLRTGSSFLRQYLSASNGRAVCGGEYAGHYVFNDGRGLGYDDGLYAALRILEYWLLQPQPTFSALMAAYPERAYTQDTYIATHQQPPQKLFAHLLQQAALLVVPVHTSQIDGVRLDFADGFGILRASNTGDYFTVRFEAGNITRLYAIRDIFVDLLNTAYPNIAQDIRLIQSANPAAPTGEANATATNGRR